MTSLNQRSQPHSTPGASWAGSGGRKDASWKICESQDRFELDRGGQVRRFVGDEIELLFVRRRWLVGSHLEVRGDRTVDRLKGLKFRDAATLGLALSDMKTKLAYKNQLSEAIKWHQLVLERVGTALSKRRWIPEEAIQQLSRQRPELNSNLWFASQDGAALARSMSEAERESVAFLESNLRPWIAEHNEKILKLELQEQREFFDRVESTPLTPEQSRAVVCFDNRVNVVAAAGSGKTSVMVARAAYAIHKGFVKPDRILMLAFNKAAAAELQERVQSRLKVLGLPTKGLKASTFHSFGLSLIGQATGRKPRLASWLEGGQDVAMVMRIVDELSKNSLDFRFKWDVFRLLYARVGNELDAGEPDGWDPKTRRTGHKTFNGEVVKSEGERLIADWLYLNGVHYAYEHPYSVDVASTTHSQYRPDFYYPDVDVWHEHWAIGYDGKPPKEFVGYADSMKWKRDLHQRQGTTLVETTWAEIIDLSGLTKLASDLDAQGIELDWNPDRPIRNVKPFDSKQLARLIRTFMSHVKSNSLTRASLNERAANGSTHFRSPRTKLFLELYWQIHDEWEKRLIADDSVDFEDMLVRAAKHLETGDVTSDFDLVLVDEFQDASQARARLVAALVDSSDKYLLAVGDDWQSINRFAGADISVMTNFEKRFGRGHVLKLQTTFRCTQEICDVSSEFVSKNPQQIEKKVESFQAARGERMKLHRASAPEEVPEVIREWLDGLAADVREGRTEQGYDGVITVDVLGRYNFDRDLMPDWKAPGFKLTFRTIHGAKGLEADYVIVPNLTRGTYGFPSQIEDDPVLELAMSDADEFPHSEERRLLYVAMTRARRQVVLIGVEGAESPFLVELLDDNRLAVSEAEDLSALNVCPKCKEGTLVTRSGQYGAFYGCTSFPRCRHTQQTVDDVLGAQTTLESEPRHSRPFVKDPPF